MRQINKQNVFKCEKYFKESKYRGIIIIEANCTISTIEILIILVAFITTLRF